MALLAIYEVPTRDLFIFRRTTTLPRGHSVTQENSILIWVDQFLDYWPFLLSSFINLSNFSHFLASGDFWRLLIPFTNSLDPNQGRQNVGFDLDPNCLTLWLWYLIFLLLKRWQQKHEKLPSMQRVKDSDEWHVYNRIFIIHNFDFFVVDFDTY